VVARDVGSAQHLLPPQNLLGSDGRTYGSNGWLAPRYGRKALELQLIRPGRSVTSTLVWELPAGVRPVAVEFRGDLIFAAGTRRSLR
jgi:hypothetical protein